MSNEYLEPLWEAFETYAEYPAIVDRGAQRLTSYAELKEGVCRVMAWLQAQGIDGASFIPIVLPQSMEYLAAEIGIWMAGHTAVPMGTAFPADRIAYICKHCDAPLVIDEAAWAQIEQTSPAGFVDDAPSYPVEEQPALLIYTSGSTGAPKGILHTFQGLATKHTSKVGLTYSPDEVWAMGAPLYFVASLTCFKVLKEGGQLHLFDSETYHDVRKVEDYIVEHGVTFTFLSPAMLQHFHNRSDTLKVVFTGSERLTGQCSRDGYKLLNCYGMSETGGTVTAFEVKHPYETTPVGKPEETWCLLDDEGNSVEEGEEGEFCLIGRYCAGYYKDPERTAELYRDGWLHTGDILRQLPDGNLVYVNRKDWMAKINGQRVEPGEVENACRKVEGVDQAVVKAFDGEGSSQYLCAFYTGTASADDIRDELAQKLPPYMVPSYFVVVREFALLPNGKVNRKVLAAPDISALRSGYVAPENDVQAALCEAFAGLFGLEQVGIDDDFFLLGGDSIRVMQLQQACPDLPLSAKTVSSQRTPRKIAMAIQGLSDEGASRDGGELTSGPCPLTQTQLGIYVESMAREGEAAYNNPVLLQLDSSLDEQRLARAVETAVEAHPFVKIHVEEDDQGTPFMVAGNASYRQAVEQMDQARFEEEKRGLIAPFDLHVGPLFRIRIIRTPLNLYLFSDFHHLIYDGTSMRIFMADVDAAYAGKPVEPETFTGFDVSIREAELRASEAYAQAKDYYESVFGGLDVESKPLPDCAGADVEYGTQDIELGVDVAAVRRFCRRLGVTENVLAISAFGKLLGSYANADESLFATIYNGRSDLREARTVSMMVKTLPVYCHWDAQTRVSDYLAAVKSQVIDSMANDLYSFAEVAASTGATSDVLFAYQGDYLALGTVCAMPFERIDLGGNATGAPLDFQLFAADGTFVLHVEYQRNQYSDAFVADMARCYDNVLAGLLLVEYMGDIELVDADQVAELESFHGRELPYDQSQTIVSMFRSAAALHPQRVAAACADEQVTYVELDQLTDNLADYIRNLGIGEPGDVVSVLVPRGLWMPVASLGALKAGCAYQPLDATYPPERLNFMIGDAQAKLLITTEELRPIITEYDGEVLIVDALDDLLAIAPDNQVSLPAPSPDDLFILLYTSGTTGVPKGVRLTHRNLVCFTEWYKRYYALGPAHRVGAYASYGFDACMMDMYPALTTGAEVVIVPEQIRLDLMAMERYLSEHGVTHLFMTTQVGRQFAVDTDCATLEHLSMGGETLVPFDVPARPPMHNGYGPTECTIFSTIYELRGGESSYPIGKPLDNMHAYVVGTTGKRLPIGAVGELWLAGPQVGDGYLNRPDKTAEAFGVNPFAAGGHAALYRTGDVVRWMRDGNIEFIGRRDGQVKIRGFRVELAEVESVVREFPGVRDATVAAFDHPSGGKFVAAYVVSDETIDIDALGDFIRERKPPYMVPAATMQIDRIPLNQNSKVDRRALPLPQLVAPDEGIDDVRPMNALEKELHAIAADVIGTDAFGVATPLSRCGMTSIQSIRLLALVYKRLGVSIHAGDLDDDTSVVTLENMIIAEWMAGNVSAPTSSEAPEQFRAPLTFAQVGVYYECLKNPDSLAYNIPTSIVFSESVAADEVEAAVRKVVAAHPVLQMRFEQVGEEVALVPCGHDVPIDRIKADEVELSDVQASFVRTFDLHEGPLARFALVEGGQGVRLLSDFHHLAFDGASTALFLRDLAAALGGGDVEVETYTYADFAMDQKRFESSEEFAANREYFADMLVDFEAASELAPDVAGGKGGGIQKVVSVPFDLPAVESYCKNAAVTPAAFMLAATSYALARYVNDRSVYLATISSGREDARTADTIGMFVNTLPLAVTMHDESVSSYVSQCAQVLAGVRAHERYPFARIASDFGYAPQIVYEYQIGVIDAEDLGTKDGFPFVAIEGMAADEAKFKLSIHIEQSGGEPSVVVYFDDALYSEALAESLAQSIVITARKMLASPDADVRGISLLDDKRKSQIEGFHEQGSGPLAFTRYHEGLERQARLKPDSRALVAADGTFTFAELNAHANRIAHALIARDVPPRSRIALLLPRTSRVIMAAFGVMKAGCAYIPCDPSYPEERVSYILSDSQAPLVITTADRVATYDNAIDVEELLACTCEDNPGLDVSPRDLAYLIYTSGSTGKPKGVMLTHEGVCNFHANNPANILVDTLVREAHAFLSVTTLSFDMSVKETGTPLVNGLAVVLADESQVNDPAKLAQLFVDTGADAFNATHSRLRQYLESPAFAAAIGRCKVVLSGGEKYTEGLLPMLQRITDARIINTYGPTETTVSSNMKDLTHERRISVGRPLYNVWECIVDADGNELPVGVVGELLIGGLGVGLGYHGLPDKTAEAFIERDGRRMYRSGDYARWTPSGDVEILGRTDNQIKLRGLRIEIGEVESALASIDCVENVVVKIGQINGVEHLCAFYTATRPLDVVELREQLAKTLAGYMVPTGYRQLDALPLTPNGKVDFRALPQAELFRAGASVAASNEVEQAFCDIFSEILGVSDVGATDSFFEIGGTSLMAIRITVEAEKAGYQVTFADVFANPTPRGLAGLCGAGVEQETPEYDAEVADFDYTAIDDLLAANNLRSFVDGAGRPLGNILLTGAVGYLGIHILREFLENYNGTAYCLLRSTAAISAQQRLKHQLFYYFESDYASLFGTRIIVLEGDVTKPLQIADDVRIDTVVNCAAVVKHFSSGTEIEDVNIGGPANLVEFCLAKDTPLIQISTGSTMKCPLVPGATLAGKTTERQLYVGQDLQNKYVRSKFLAERLVLDAVATRGLVGKVMRVGNLAPRTADGEFQINYGTNAAMGRLKSYALLGCVSFDQLDATMEFSPIDQTARAILLLAQTPADCVVFHPFNHHKVFMGDVFEAMRLAGLEVQPVERDTFMRALREAEADPEKARILTSMLAYARKATGKPVVVPVAGNDYTMQVLYRLGFRWDPTSTAYVEQFLDSLEGLGFFDLED